MFNKGLGTKEKKEKRTSNKKKKERKEKALIKTKLPCPKGQLPEPIRVA